MQETQVRSLGWEDPLEECIATHSSILAWRIPIDRRAGWATVHGVAKSQTRLSNLSTVGRKLTPAALPNKPNSNLIIHLPTTS